MSSAVKSSSKETDLVRLCQTGVVLSSWLAFVCYVAVVTYTPSVLPQWIEPLSCLFKILFALPCPFCGITRSLTNSLHGQLRQAMFYHPFAIPIVVLFTYSVGVVIKKFRTNQEIVLSTSVLRAWLVIGVLSWWAKMILPKTYW